jgi:acyl-CoA thioesterase-1
MSGINYFARGHAVRARGGVVTFWKTMKKLPSEFRAAALAATVAVNALGQAPIRLACIGNSITQGTVAGVKPYAVKLQSLLGAGYKVQNDGVSGCTLLKKGDKPYWTKGKLDSVFAFKPDIVTIKLGTNDSKDVNWKYKNDFVKDYKALVDTLGRISPKPKIYLCLPVPAWPVNGVDSYNVHGTLVENEVVPRIDSVAKARGLAVIDLHNPMKDMQSHFADGVHPDQAGQDKIAQLMYAALTASSSSLSAGEWPPHFAAALQGNILRIDLPRDVSGLAEILDLGGSRLISGGVGKGGGILSLVALAPGAYVLSLRTAPDGRILARPFDLGAAPKLP